MVERRVAMMAWMMVVQMVALRVEKKVASTV
jgi:hypothetical protein